MSWLPSEDASSKTLPGPVELVLLPRAHDLGGFEVRRALPASERQMVGPLSFSTKWDPASSWPAAASTSGRTRI